MADPEETAESAREQVDTVGALLWHICRRRRGVFRARVKLKARLSAGV